MAESIFILRAAFREPPSFAGGDLHGVGDVCRCDRVVVVCDLVGADHLGLEDLVAQRGGAMKATQIDPNHIEPKLTTERGADDVHLTTVERGAQVALANEWLVKQQLQLDHTMRTGYDNALAVVEILNRIDKRITPPIFDDDEHHEPACCERYCEDPASPKHSGRCKPCYDWRWRWSDAHGGEPGPYVPREIIDQRIKLRENRKVHINGPLASGTLGFTTGS